MPFLMAALYDPMTRRVEAAGLADRRRRLLAALSGEVLEIGAGTGHNLKHYPSGLTRLVATEPDRFMRERLEHAAGGAGLGFPVEVAAAPAERLPFPDESFDAVVGTLVLCSVADPAACLAEARRVLRPGGRLLVLEHVAAAGRPSLARWQRRLEPLWKRVAGGCHLTRHTDRLIAEAGFGPVELERDIMRKAPAVVQPIVVGWAQRG